ncbi:UNVERIFIED_CONTAM: hypothetical protein GTU68_063436 [Idotea baltica]|nr:hypothetical protein [Idotea baltica]
MKTDSILGAIGGTPHVKINKLFKEFPITVWMKLERNNPGGSIKDRIAFEMIEDAESKGILKPDSVIIEPTSGNTGIGLALVAAVKGYRVILVMPESMSLERRRLMAAYGAELVLTPKEEGLKGALSKATELAESTKGSWVPQQFENPANIAAHYQTTSKEIVADFPEGLDYLITGVGTGGHLTGCAQALKEQFPKLQAFAVEPEDSPVISGGAGFIPKNLHIDSIDGSIAVSAESAKEYARRAAAEEGILIGISSGASLAAIAKKAPELPAGSSIITFCYDTGERYLSVEGFLPLADA